jgi:serine/threonine protein kinase/WD40 repeat protein
MNDTNSERDPVDALAEEFVARYRRGERPSLSEYINRCPELADEIRALFPALVMMEDVRPRPGGSSAATDDKAGAAGPTLERLGDYRILREVGRGGMGVVYEVEQESLGRHVTLKVLPARALLDARHVQRFHREAKAAVRLHHTNIVPVFGLGEDGGLQYYVMQFIQGLGLDQVLDELQKLRTLKGGTTPAPDRIGQSAPIVPISAADVAAALLTGRFSCDLGAAPTAALASSALVVAASASDGPGADLLAGPAASTNLSASGRGYWRSVARIGVQTAEALAHAHAQGVLHRDIKPSNLLLDTRGTVWVTDFGLAKTSESDDLTHTGDVVGTLRYMAPERFQGKSDPRGDVYGLGITLYELLALRPAFDETDRNQLLGRLQHEEPPRLRRVNPQVPRDLETIVLKAIAKEPERRYATAAELAEDLRRFLADRPIRARRSSAVERGWRWCRRNPALGSALMFAALGALATVALSIWFALYQAEANDELRRRQAATEAALFQSRLDAARLAEERALGLLRQGETNPGLIWLAHALELAPERATDLRGNLCRQLACWPGHATALRQVLAHPAGVTALAFSPDGRLVYTGCADGRVRQWEARSGKLLGEPAALAAAVDRLVPNADGQTLCALNKRERRFLDAVSGDPLPGTRGAFPPWKLLADPLARCSADGQTVIRMQPVMSMQIPTFALGTLTEETGPGRKRTMAIGATMNYEAATLSSDGKLFLIQSTVRSSATGQDVGPALRDSLLPTVAAFRPDDKALLTANPHNLVRAWDVLTGESLCQPLPHPDRVTALAYSPDGRLALTACADGGARLWDLTPPMPDCRDVEVSVLKGDGGREQRLTFHDGRCTVVDASKNVYGLDGEGTKHRCMLPLTGQLDRVAVAHGGQVLTTASRDERNNWGRPAKVRFWDANTGEPVGPTLVHPDTVWTLAFSPDGETLATACFDGKVRFWKVGTDTPAGPTLSHPAQVSNFPVVFSPDGRRVVTGCADMVRLWDRDTGELLATFPHPRGITDLAVAPGGRRLLVGGGGTARLWDLGTNKPVGPSLPHATDVTAVAFSPDGQVAVTGASGAVQFWEASTGLPLGPPRRPPGVWGLAFAPDGEAVLVGHGGRNIGYYLVPVQRPVPDDAPRLVLSAQVLTGLELDEGGAIRVLNATAWNDRRRQLDEMGGSLLPKSP